MLELVNLDFVHADREKREPEFYEFRREKGKKCATKVVAPFYPYLYVEEKEKVPASPYIKQITEGFTSLYGEKVKKVNFFNITKNDFLAFRDLFEKTYEDDVDFRTRYIIDNKVEFSSNQRILYLDIETDMSVDSAEAPEEIISIAVFDSILNKYLVFCWHEDFEEREEKNEKMSKFYFNSEKNMLHKFLAFFSTCNPDIVTGWNVEQFDFAYLINRMRRLKIDPAQLSLVGKVECFQNEDNKEWRVKIFGVEILDMKECHRKLANWKSADNSLNAIAQHYFESGKYAFEGIRACWNKEKMEELIKYNFRDVEILVEIEKKLGLLSYFLVVQQIVPIPLRNIFYNSRVIDVFLLRNFHNKIVFDSKRKHEARTFKGALFTTPRSKMYENVAVFDFVGMYPTIIASFNLSPETLIENGDLSIQLPDETFSVSTKNEGILSQIVKIFQRGRKKYKEARDSCPYKSLEYVSNDIRQSAFKTILNSIYGTMSYPSFRLYKPEVSKIVAFLGRELLVNTTNFLNDKGYEVIYSATDSMFVLVKSEDFLVESQNLEREINKFLDEYLSKKYHINTSSIEVAFSEFFSRIAFFGVKNKYAGKALFDKQLLDAPVYKFKGVEVIRRDTPLAIKPVLKAATESVLEGEFVYDIKKKLVVAQKKLMKADIFDLAIPKHVSRDVEDYQTRVQHVEAARYSNQFLGLNISSHDRPRMLYVKNEKHPRVSEIMLLEETGLPLHIKIDFDRIFEKQIYDKLKLFNGLENENFNFKYVPIEQKTLERWV